MATTIITFEDVRALEAKEEQEESILAMLGIIGTFLNLFVIVFVYIYTTVWSGETTPVQQKKTSARPTKSGQNPGEKMTNWGTHVWEKKVFSWGEVEDNQTGSWCEQVPQPPARKIAENFKVDPSGHIEHSLNLCGLKAASKSNWSSTWTLD